MIICKTQTTRNRGAAHYRRDGATRRKRNENRTWPKQMCTYMYRYGYVDVNTCQRTGAEGSRGLEAQFCSVNLWRRARGVYHSASEFVVPRLVTSRSVFRTQPRTLLPCSPSTLYSRLFTCITFAEDIQETSTCLCAFKVASQKPRTIGRTSVGFDSV